MTMLIKSPIKSGTVVTLKFINGEESIARFVSDTSTTVTVSRPASLVQAQQGMGMAPFLFTANHEELVIYKTSLMFEPVPTDGQIAGKYIEQSTGIAI